MLYKISQSLNFLLPFFLLHSLKNTYLQKRQREKIALVNVYVRHLNYGSGLRLIRTGSGYLTKEKKGL